MSHAVPSPRRRWTSRRSLASGSRERAAATRANERHAADVRAQLRTVLWEAAVGGRLDGLNAQPEHLGWRAGEALDVDPAVELAVEDDDDDEVGFV